MSLVAAVCCASSGIAAAQDAAEQRRARAEKFEVLRVEFRQLKEQVAADKALVGLEKMFEKKILKLVEEHSLSDAQAARLRVAAKGATKHHLKAKPVEGLDLPAWAMDFTDYYHRSGDLVFIGEWKNRLALEQPIWVNAVDQVISADHEQERRDRQEYRIRILIDQCVYRIDGKLKLKAKQRAVIREWVESGIGKELRSIRCQSQRMFAYPVTQFLSELTDEKLSTVLNPQQVEKWPEVIGSLVR